MNDLIVCPHCNQKFEMSTAVTAELRSAMTKELEQELETKLEKVRQEATKYAKAELELELEDLKAKDKENNQKLIEFQRQELDLRKQSRLLEEQKQSMELNIARQLDAQKKEVEEAAIKRMQNENHLKDLEKDKQLDDFKKQVEELKRKMEIGSQQSQGEIQELDLENILRSSFPTDDLVPVAKGVQGADIIQHVRNKYGKLCEKIIWESKRTKHWSDQWADKLKDDSRKMNGFLSVIVSQTLPPSINGFGYYEGVWVCDYHSIIGLATALRMQIIHVCHVRDSHIGKDEKMETLYNYLTSHQFRGRVEAIVDSFQQMKSDLDREKEAFRRMWAKREKEIERITDNTVGMYGDMQGLIGGALPSLPTLDISLIETDEDHLSKSSAKNKNILNDNQKQLLI